MTVGHFLRLGQIVVLTIVAHGQVATVHEGLTRGQSLVHVGLLFVEEFHSMIVFVVVTIHLLLFIICCFCCCCNGLLLCFLFQHFFLSDHFIIFVVDTTYFFSNGYVTIVVVVIIIVVDVVVDIVVVDTIGKLVISARETEGITLYYYAISPVQTLMSD